MPFNRRDFIRSSLAGSAALCMSPAMQAATHSFRVTGDHFMLDGKPFQIFSGSMHYPRVPRPYWRDRMRKARALGLNTLCVYVFWNAHETRPGEFDFTGNLDLKTYIQTAQEEGLWVILRPGPYVCAEWEFGGLPWWLLKNPNMRVRTSNPDFLAAASKYFHRLAEEIAPLQITRGGPIILCQVENEYGSFGSDHGYMQAIRKTIIESGFDVVLYTSDGSSRLEEGTLPGLVATINFGAGEDTAAQFARLAQFRPNGPKMCGEYWDGWFDHWGETHHRVPAKTVTQGLEWMLSRGISVNLYMFHGGTTFGFMPGANQDKQYQPDISSYDYDAPLDEAGRPTPKYFAIQELLQKHRQQSAAPFPALPAPLPAISIPRFHLENSAPLLAELGEAAKSARPKTMEEMDQPYGMVLYRAHVQTAMNGKLEVQGAHDYAIVYCNGKRLGALDRRFKETTLPVNIPAGATLDILVDAMGRVNFGPHLGEDRKGLTGTVTLNGTELTGWEQYSFPLANPAKRPFTAGPVDGPAFYKAVVTLEEVGDTFLDMRGWGKGYVWVNGRNLGRYWNVGPQRSLFLPGVWLQQGTSEFIVLDLEQEGDRSLESHREPIYDMAIEANAK